jgi:hypothetical protein
MGGTILTWILCEDLDMALPFAATFAMSAIPALLGGISGQSEADAANRQAEATYKQNFLNWKFGRKTTKLDYRHERDQWRLNKRNEKVSRKWRDATNLQDWNFALKIQDAEFNSEMELFNKSNEIADQQLTFNAMAQKVANEAEYRKLEDTTKEIAFQNQDIILKAVQSEDMAAVKGQQGRTPEKAGQAELASLGRNQAILAESLLSARADTQAAMRKIATDKFGADLAANASRRLEPKRLPKPPKPLKTPKIAYLKPRKPTKYDFGPRPTKGAMASSAGSWMEAGGKIASAAIGGIGEKWFEFTI